MSNEEIIIANCVDTIRALRAHSSLSITMNHIEILFIIFLNDKITRNDLATRIPKLTHTTVKRYVKDLIHEHELVTETDCEEDFRLKHLHISERGHQLIATVVNNVKKCATKL